MVNCCYKTERRTDFLMAIAASSTPTSSTMPSIHTRYGRSAIVCLAHPMYLPDISEPERTVPFNIASHKDKPVMQIGNILANIASQQNLLVSLGSPLPWQCPVLK